ncbi:hypothetical protein [Streptomyces sp. NPDC008001]|uniref:hypothetical protein n=1 Tax=Streptomyces sp. NPDC008001 TaxID=3364804 RepID=UPI0036E58405
MAAVRVGGHTLVSEEREFVVHDSDESLDAGWIDETDDAGVAGWIGENGEGTGA